MNYENDAVVTPAVINTEVNKLLITAGYRYDETLKFIPGENKRLVVSWSIPEYKFYDFSIDDLKHCIDTIYKKIDEKLPIKCKFRISAVEYDRDILVREFFIAVVVIYEHPLL